MNWLQYRIEQIESHLYSQFPGLRLTVLETYLYSLAIICVMFGIYSLGKFLLGIRRIKSVDSFFFWAECTVCGWKGEASRVFKRCPLCYSRRLKEVEGEGKRRKKGGK